MRLLLVVALLAGQAQAESWAHWWRHHVIRCACIGNPPIKPGRELVMSDKYTGKLTE